jgi:hypothetical protein
MWWSLYVIVATGRLVSPGPPVSSTNKIYLHDITELLLNMTLSTIKPNQTMTLLCLTVTEYLCHKWPRTCSTCSKHFPVLYLFMISLSWLVFVTRVARCASQVEQKLPTLPEYLNYWDVSIFTVNFIHSLLIQLCSVFLSCRPDWYLIYYIL